MIDGLDHEALSGLLAHPPLGRLLDALNGNGEETRLVGGAVRNALLGRPVKDRDCTTTGSPEVTIRRAEGAGFKTVPTGIEHGTVTVIVEGEPFEVTTLREDVETDGRHAVVRFGRDFVADAHRRDFTINALSLGRDGTLHDYTGGVADLAARRVRFIGEARTRIREDYLRILRFFRFHAEYGEGRPDSAGLEASVRERAGLATLSHERIRAEFLKLLVAPRAVETLGDLAEHGFLTLLLGAAAELGRFARTVEAETRGGPWGGSALAPPDAVRRLAALAVMTPEDADRLRDRLRLSNEEHRRLMGYAALVERLKARPLVLDGVAMRRLVAAEGADSLVDALAAIRGEPRPALHPEALVALSGFASGRQPVPVFPLRGGDLVEAGLAPGPRIGELLAKARQAWIAEGCPEDEAARASLLRRILGHAVPSE